MMVISRAEPSLWENRYTPSVFGRGGRRTSCMARRGRTRRPKCNATVGPGPTGSVKSTLRQGARMTRTFREGDRVRHKGEGPIMVVNGYEGEKVTCAWYVTGEGWKKETFPENT